jgi:beta-alanine--pyruvate transaminase
MAERLDAYWMPFTANRQFKKAPRLLAKASGMHYWTDDGRKILDAVAGLWCVNAGHARPKIVQAIAAQAAELDYAPPFQMGHPKAFELAERLVQLTPKGLGKVFFTNSGSESVETALKMAIAYQRVRGQASRTRLIGRERGYHGVNFGGISVGGMVGNRKMFGTLLAGVDHIRHTHDLQRNAFSRGLPAHGAELADDLERLVQLHDASTIAAVIVEPVAGSTGVLLPPQGYLQRLREICDRHGILLIFDEVITGFGRTGTPFAAETFGVTPDLMTVAKGVTNGCVPMGAVFAKNEIHDAFMTGPEHLIEFFHGYTTRWLAPRRWPRWTPTRTKACSRARRNSKAISRMPCTRCATCPTSSTCATSASWAASSCSRCPRRLPSAHSTCSSTATKRA